MSHLSVSAFEELVKQEASKLKLKVISITTTPDDLGFAVSDVYVENKDRNKTFASMRKLEHTLHRILVQDVRLGWYEKAIGYDDVPVGQAMIEIDCVTLVF